MNDSSSKTKEGFERVLLSGIAEYGSSFSRPNYGPRLKPLCQELLNEYCHHVISQCKTRQASLNLLKAETERISKEHQTPVPDLEPMLIQVFDKEGRMS